CYIGAARWAQTRWRERGDMFTAKREVTILIACLLWGLLADARAENPSRVPPSSRGGDQPAIQDTASPDASVPVLAQRIPRGGAEEEEAKPPAQGTPQPPPTPPQQHPPPAP